MLFAPHLDLQAPRFVSCAEIFDHHLGLDLFADDERALQARCHELGFASCQDKNDAFDFLIDEVTRQYFSGDRFTVLDGYPPQQAQLARSGATAERFEVYLGSVELANGYSELTDAKVCEQRLRDENARRLAVGRQALPVSKALLAAVQAGLPDCAGVSVGLDRILMCLGGKDQIADTMAFAWDRA